jgi:L-iditol 2-dehydrogenase
MLVCRRTAAVELEEVPEPVIGAGELLIQMSLCGVCGTDIMKVYDDSISKPVQLGHEIVGVVADAGAGVGQFRKGQRVALAHHAPDFGSHYTRRGSETVDPLFKATNVDPSGFADFIRVPGTLVPHTVLPIPDGMPDERAVFMEPVACCLRALDRARVVEGDTVMVVGVGAIGLLFVPLLRDRSATVLAVDLRPERLKLAIEWRASAGIELGRDDPVAVAQSMSEGRGCDLVILTVVNASTIETALSALRDGGTILLFGVKPGMMPQVDLWQLYRREVNVVTSYSTTPDMLARALAILNRPRYTLETTVGLKLPLTDAARGFEMMHNGKASKVVISN